MIQRALHSNNFIARLLILNTGAILFLDTTLPENKFILQLIGLRTPEVKGDFPQPRRTN